MQETGKRFEDILKTILVVFGGLLCLDTSFTPPDRGLALPLYLCHISLPHEEEAAKPLTDLGIGDHPSRIKVRIPRIPLLQRIPCSFGGVSRIISPHKDRAAGVLRKRQYGDGRTAIQSPVRTR